jgi:hypothetical protein
MGLSCLSLVCRAGVQEERISCATVLQPHKMRLRQIATLLPPCRRNFDPMINATLPKIVLALRFQPIIYSPRDSRPLVLIQINKQIK